MGASHFVGLELRREAEAPPPILPNFSYASANRRSRRATYPTVCSKRATLLDNANGPTACAGTERDNGMLGRQLFGPGGRLPLPNIGSMGGECGPQGRRHRIPSAVH